MGGAIFVVSGGRLTITGTGNVAGGSVAGGSGAGGAGNGSAYASGFFVEGSNVTFGNGTAGGAGTYTIADVIADLNGSAGNTTTQNGVGGTGGASSITVNGASLALWGANTYTGGTELRGGTLVIGSSSALGTGGLSITGSGTTLRATGDVTVSNTVSIADNVSTTISAATGATLALNGTIGWGYGTAVHFGSTSDAGTVDLSGATWSTIATNGRVSVDYGVLRGGSSASSALIGTAYGGFNVAAGATFDLNGRLAAAHQLSGGGVVANNGADATLYVTNLSDSVFAGRIEDGTGKTSLTVQWWSPHSPATLTLTGANSYTGATTIGDPQYYAFGTLVIGNGGSIGSAATPGGAIFVGDGSFLTVLAGGSINISSNGLTNKGTVSVAAGGSITDDLINAGVVTNAGTYTADVRNSAPGSITNAGGATWSGNVVSNTGTIVNDGTWIGNIVNSGILSGMGTVNGNVSIQAGGTFAPGSGTAGTSMVINGNLAFQSGAIYLVQLTPSATSASVSGTAALAGTVNAVFASGSYFTRQYTILQSSGLNGTTFSGLATSNLPAGFQASLAYTGNDVLLNLVGALPTGGFNANQQNVAGALNNFFNSGGTLPPNFLNVFALTGPALGTALSQLSGEAATGAEQGAFQMTNEFLGLMLDPFVNGRGNLGGGAAGGNGPASGFAPDGQAGLPPDIALAYAAILKAPPKPSFEQRWSAWGAAYGGGNTAQGDVATGSNDLTVRTYGFVGGLDYRLSPNTVVGFALAGGGTSWGTANALGTGRSDAFQAGAYGISRVGPAYVAGAIAFTNHWFTTNRSALGDQLTASFVGQSYGVRLEGGYRMAVSPTFGVTPYGALQFQDFHTPSYGESDVTGGGFGLSYASKSATDARTELGARFENPTLLNGKPLVLFGRLAWAHDFVGDSALGAVFQALPGSAFTVNGAPIPRDSALTTAGLQYFLNPDWQLIAKFDGQFAGGSQTYAGTGTLRHTW